MFDKLIDIAEKMNKEIITGVYIPTKKNKIVAELYETLGFKRIESPKNSKNEIHYQIKAKNLKKFNQSIKVEHE